MQALCDWLLPHWLPRYQQGGGKKGGFDAAELYSAVKPAGDEPMLLLQPPELLPVLRPYQRRAAAWMLAREGVVQQQQQQQQQQEQHGAAGPQEGTAAAATPDLTALVRQQLHPAWWCALLLQPPVPTAIKQSASSSRLTAADAAVGAAAAAMVGSCTGSLNPNEAAAPPLTTATGPDCGNGALSSDFMDGDNSDKRCSSCVGSLGVLYFCPFSLLVSRMPFAAPHVPGGILADEMGLGKTVELLALISTHRFQPVKQEQQEPQPAAAGVAAGSNSGRTSKRSNRAGCCSRCGELLDQTNYAKDGWLPKQQQQHHQQLQRSQRGKRRRYDGSDLESDAAGDDGSDDDDDEFDPAGRQQLRGRLGSRTSQRQQQQHGVGHHGAKRQRRDTSRQQQQQQQQEDEAAEISEEENTLKFTLQWGGKRKRGSRSRGGSRSSSSLAGPSDAPDTRQRQQQQEAGVQEEEYPPHGTAGANTAAAAAAGGGGAEVLCSTCLRELALQEVQEDCGTTLIVVPSNILVQWVDELLKHIKPGSLTLKVYVGQFQPGAAAAVAAVPKGKSRSRRSSSNDGSSHRSSTIVREVAAAAAGAGAAAGATAAGQVVTAAELAATDVVVTTYDVLKRELTLQPGNECIDRTLRRRKRYAVVPTPLSRLVFWRLVLDEAQQVAGSTAKAAEMAQHVRAVHRWAVTGTPISRGLEDLSGILHCLQAEPWASKRWWWRNAIARPVAGGCQQGVEVLLSVMRPRRGGLLWRSAKADVLHEMGLPPQAHHTTILRLSAIERHWYNRAHQDCAAKARKVLQDAVTASILSSRRSSSADAATAAKAAAASAAAAAIAAGGDGRELDGASAAVLGPLLGRHLLPAEQKKLLLPLLRLRQACIHPQVGAAGLRAALIGSGSSGSSGTPLTMDQILGVLTSKARVEAEEAQRQLIGALNGLAALLRLSGDAPGSVAAYRQALGTSEANKQEVRTDPLQLLHTLHNLANLLAELARKYNPAAAAAGTGSGGTAAAPQQQQQQQRHPYGPGVPRTLRDDSLASEAAAIQDTYLAQRQSVLATAHTAYLKALKDALQVGRHKRSAAAAAAAGAAGGAGSSRPAAAAGASKRRQQGAGSWARALMDTGSDDDVDDSSWIEEDLLLAAGQPAAGEDEEAEGDGSASAPGLGWYIAVIDALIEAEKGEEVAELIKQKLQEGDTYRRKVEKNATNLANRFNTLHGLKLLINQELSAMSNQQAAAVTLLGDLQGACTAPEGPEQGLVETAGQCGRCRAEMGVAGVVCRHCGLDEVMRKWEVRLFSLHTKALAAGMQVDADEAARQAQLAANRRIGRGGLNEEAAEDAMTDIAAGGAGARRQEAQVSEAQVVRHPSEVERILRLLQQQLAKQGLGRHLPGVSEAASSHLDRLEGSRRLFIAAGALAVAQRQLLYAHDELSMALLRISTRMEGEQVTAHEALFKLSPAEQVIKNAELSLERSLAEGDLSRALGKVRYLRTIGAAKKRAAAAATAKATAAAAAADGGGEGGSEVAGVQQQQQQQQKGMQQPSGCSAPAAIAATAAGQPADQVSPRAAAAAAALKRAAAAAAAAGEDQGLTEQQQPQTQQQQQLEHPQEQQQQQKASQNMPAPAPTADPAATPAAAAPAAAGDSYLSDMAESCPICHEQVETAAAVLPCGHILCCSCADALAARIPAATPPPQRRIACPNCRCRAHVSDVAYVDSGRSSTYSYVRTNSTLPGAGTAGAGGAGSAGGGAGAGSPGSSAAADADAAASPVSRRGSSSGGAGSDGSSSDCSYPWQGEQELVVAGSYGTKVEAVVRRLLFLLQIDPGNKVIVFSTWLDVLDIVSHALTANGIRHAFGKGRKGFLRALEQFKGSSVAEEEAGVAGKGVRSRLGQQQQQLGTAAAGEDADEVEDEQLEAAGDEDELGCEDMEVDGDAAAAADAAGKAGCRSTAAAVAASKAADGGGARSVQPRVLLLLVSQGAAGLNLTEAQHVLLLEPLLDPAQELQATGRVSRFGQTATTHVHRFIIQHTVEENVARISRQRAAAMDMSAAVPTGRRAGSSGSGGGAAGEAADLTVRDVAALLSSKWSEGSAGDGPGTGVVDLS